MSTVTDLQEYKAALTAYAALPHNVTKLRYTVDCLVEDLQIREFDRVLALLQEQGHVVEYYPYDDDPFQPT